MNGISLTNGFESRSQDRNPGLGRGSGKTAPGSAEYQPYSGKRERNKCTSPIHLKKHREAPEGKGARNPGEVAFSSAAGIMVGKRKYF